MAVRDSRSGNHPGLSADSPSDRDAVPRRSRDDGLRDRLFTYSKWGFYSVTIVAIAQLPLFILYVLLINEAAGVAGGFITLFVLVIWVIIAAITLPVMALCQRRLPARSNRMIYFIALVLGLMGAMMAYSNGSDLHWLLTHPSKFDERLRMINFAGAALVGVLAIAACLMLLMPSPGASTVLLAAMTVQLVMLALNIMTYRMRLDVNAVIRLLPMVIVISAYLYVRRQFATNPDFSSG